jgi:hypothetical protein
MTTHRTNQFVSAPLARHKLVASRRLGAVVSVAVLGGLTAAGSPAAAAKPQTLKVLEVVTSFVGTGGFSATGHSPPAVGQGVLITGSLYKLKGRHRGQRYGAARVECTFTNSTGGSVCTAVASLPAGKLVVSGLAPGNPTKPYMLPILGGSRRYSGAKGHIQVKPIGNSNKAALTIVITG